MFENQILNSAYSNNKKFKLKHLNVKVARAEMKEARLERRDILPHPEDVVIVSAYVKEKMKEVNEVLSILKKVFFFLICLHFFFN